MPLEELEKKLYKKDSKFEERPEAPKIFETGKKVERERKEETWRPEPQIKKEPLTKKQKIIIFSIIGFVLVVSVLLVVLYLRSTAFIKTDVILKIYGPSEVISGAEGFYNFVLKNKTKVTLKDVRLVFAFPLDSESAEGTKIEKQLGDILSGQEKQMKFTARIFGAKDEIKTIQAKLLYRPENMNSLFESQTEFKVKIILIPIVFNFNLPQRAASGKDFEMTLNIINNSNANFDNLAVKIDYPIGYEFLGADLSPIFSNNIWSFKTLVSGEQKTIRIKGKISGADGEVKDFVASLGRLKDGVISSVYIEEKAAIKISSPLLNIFTTVNNLRNLNVNAGDELNFKIKYKNTSDANIGDVVVKVVLDSQVLDLTTLDIDFGYYNPQESAIFWTAASIPDFKILAPQKEGELTFSVNVKSTFPVKTFNDKNFTIKTIASINASNIPSLYSGIPVGAEDVLELKTNSIIQIKAIGYYKNNTIPNFGPIPPRVGQKTSYTIFWQLINYSNDLENVVVEGFLPNYVIWENKFAPTSENLIYDKISGKVRWQIDRLTAGTGIFSPARQIAFQISIIPSPDQIGSILDLLLDTKVNGKDMFTGQELTQLDRDKKITTDLRNDPFVVRNRGDQVVQ